MHDKVWNGILHKDKMALCMYKVANGILLMYKTTFDMCITPEKGNALGSIALKGGRCVYGCV